MWDGERKGQSRDSAVSSVISSLERQTPGTFQHPLRLPVPSSVANGQDTHTHRCHVSQPLWHSVRINHARPSQAAISADIMPSQPSGLEIVYVQYLRSTNVKFGCRFWSHWQQWKDGLQKCPKLTGNVQ